MKIFILGGLKPRNSAECLISAIEGHYMEWAYGFQDVPFQVMKPDYPNLDILYQCNWPKKLRILEYKGCDYSKSQANIQQCINTILQYSPDRIYFLHGDPIAEQVCKLAIKQGIKVFDPAKYDHRISESDFEQDNSLTQDDHEKSTNNVTFVDFKKR